MAAAEPIAPEHRRFSIRLPRPLWIGAVAGSLIVVAIVLRVVVPIYRQRAALQEIERAGAKVTFRHVGPNWLRERLGDDRMKVFDEVVEVRLVNMQGTDVTVEKIGVLTSLERLSTDFSPNITDAGVAHLENLTRLKFLYISNPNVTDSGIAHLKGLTELRELGLANTRLSDAGLAHLVGLTKLEWLYIPQTSVTDAGLMVLKVLRLKTLAVHRTRVTSAGVANLRRAVPGLSVPRYSH